MRVFLKQYGAMRTGTNYLRMLIQANYSDVVALMHVLGDKHSPPVPLEELWRDAQREADPALAFVSSATAHAPALSTKPDDADQRREVERIATALTQAYRDGAIGFVISIKDPYAWVVSVAKYDGMASRHSMLGPQLAEAMAKKCAEYNASYASWLALAERRPSRCHVVRHEDLVEDPERVLAALDAKFGLRRSTQAFVNITRETFPAWWDQNRPRTTGVMFDRSYYLGRRYLDRLSPEVRDAVTASIDWERIAPLGYVPLESPLPAARGEG